MTSSASTESAATATGKGIAMMLLAGLMFTSMDTVAKVLLQDYGTVQVVWARYTGQTVLVLVLLAPRLAVLMRTKYPGTHVLRSFLQFGATALFFTGLTYVGLAEATAIIDVNPVLITLGAALFLGERLGPRRLFGILAALTGAMIVIRPGSGIFTPGALFPLAAAFCFAGYAILTRKLGREESVWTSLIYTALVGTLLSSLALPYYWTPIAPGLDTVLFVAIGAIGAVGQLFLIRAFSSTEAAVIAPFGYIGLIFASAWGIVVFAEYPDMWTIIGAAVIVAAGVYVWHRETRLVRIAAHRAVTAAAPPR